jgi:hypothetical protein
VSRQLIRRAAAGAMAVAVLALSASSARAEKKKNPEDSLRTAQGVVSDANDAPVDGAVVQLKNTKTLQIRSFVTQQHGAYYFHGLSPNVDYELRADYQGASSPTKTVSSFDSRKEVIINLKLAKK